MGRVHKMMASGLMDEASRFWKRWTTIFSLSGCISTFVRMLQGFYLMKAPREGHPCMSFAVQSLTLLLAGPDDSMKDKIISVATTHHRVSLPEVLFYAIDNGIEVCVCVCVQCLCHAYTCILVTYTHA